MIRWNSASAAMNAWVEDGLVHVGQAALERGQIGCVQPRCRHLGRNGLEDPPNLVQLEHRRPRHEIADESHPRQQQVGLEARDVGAVAHPRLEYADQRQRPHRLAQGVARKAEPLREVLLVRELGSGRELAGHDQVLDLGDRLIGQWRHDAPPAAARRGRTAASPCPTRSCSACCGATSFTTSSVSRHTCS